jgi:hypothetical protein
MSHVSRICPSFALLTALWGSVARRGSAQHLKTALSFAYRLDFAEIYFAGGNFFDIVNFSAIQQRAEKTCANQFLHSPLFPSQPSLGAWTMMQNVLLLAVSLVRLLPIKPVVALQRVPLLAPQPAHCATTLASAAKATKSNTGRIFADHTGVVITQFRGVSFQYIKGFQAGMLGSLFSWIGFRKLC